MENKQLNSRGFAMRVLVLTALAVAAVIAVFTRWPQALSQEQSYHHFADKRAMMGVPHFLNVISNIPYVVVGALGLGFIAIGKAKAAASAFRESRERWPYLLFFIGIFLTGFGSTYYHLRPDNDRLLWDRLPIALAFMSIFAAVIAERISLKSGQVLLAPLALLGIGSVVYWHLTELQGRGDLRPYILVQFYPLAALPLILILFPARYTRTLDLFAALVWYGLAKGFEAWDSSIYHHLGELVSGHTLKHLASAVGAYCVLRMLRLRQPR